MQMQWLTVLAQRSSFVDIDSDLIIDRATQNIKGAVLNQLDLISKTTKADIFLLMPKTPDIESASFNGNLDSTMDPRLRCAIYGDLETMEHAKTRVLIMIDQIVSLPSEITIAILNAALFSKHLLYSQITLATFKALFLLSNYHGYFQIAIVTPEDVTASPY
jgi:hypothetical protein